MSVEVKSEFKGDFKNRKEAFNKLFAKLINNYIKDKNINIKQ